MAMILAAFLACYLAIGLIVWACLRRSDPVDQHAQQAALDPDDASEVLPEYRHFVDRWIGQAYEDIYDYRRLQRLPGETSYRKENTP